MSIAAISELEGVVYSFLILFKDTGVRIACVFYLYIIS